MKHLFDKAYNLFYERPLCFGCGTFMLLCAVLLFAPTLPKLILCAAGLLFFPLFILLKSKLSSLKRGFGVLSAFFAILFFASLVCLLNYDLYSLKVKKAAEEGKTVRITCYFKEEVYTTDFSSLYIAHVESIDGKKQHGVDLPVEFGAAVRRELFTRYEGECALTLPDHSSYAFDALSYYRSMGIFAYTADGTALSPTGERCRTILRPITALRDALGRRIERAAPEEDAALLKALLIADRSDLSDSLKRDFKTFGVSHLLAVSGMHLSILILMCEFILRRLRVPLKVRSLLLILFVLLFMNMCGFTVSVVREGIMCILLLLSRIVDEKADTLTSLFCAGGLIVLISPYSVLRCSFLLSFFATLGIIVYSRFFSKKKKKQSKISAVFSYVGTSLLISLSAQIAVLPIAGGFYGSFSITAPIATTVFSLLFACILYTAPAALIFADVPFLSDFTSGIVSFFCETVQWLSSFARYFKELLVSVRIKALLPFFFLLACAVLLLLVTRRKRLFGILSASLYLVICAGSFFFPYFDSPRVIADTYKNNDLMVLYGKRSSAIVDLSDGSFSAMDRAIGLLLEETPENWPDDLILTHYHNKHANTIRKLLDTTYIDNLLLPEPSEADLGNAREIERIAKNAGVTVSYYHPDPGIKCGSGIILNHEAIKRLSRSTHPAISFDLSYDGETISYLSSSVWEKLTEVGGSLVYIGEHGPIVKKPIPENLCGGKTVLCANENVRAELSAVGNSFITADVPFVRYLGRQNDE